MSQGRVFVGLCLLATLWVVVYWVWDAPAVDSPVARITFADPIVDAPLPGESTDDASALPESGVVAPEFETHVITKAGETWESISQAFYATSKHALALSDANPYVVDLTVGREIRVPLDPTNVRGRVIEPPPAEEPAPVEAPADPPSDAPERPRIIAEHVVQPGEVLGAIAKKYYGTSAESKYMAIYEFNRERLGLRSPNAITPGDTLLIPELDE
jgi:nucleoid-associated protein YgaU